MRIAIDISPLKDGDHSFLHRVRGAGSYVENLKNSLIEFSFDNEYIFFTKGQELSKYLDIVHYPYFEPFFLTLPFIKHFKTVVTIHDLIPLVFPSHFPSGIRGKIKWQIQKLALKKVDRIITDSFCSKKDIVRFTDIKEEKIDVVYLSVGNEFKKNNYSKEKTDLLRKKYKLPEKYALYVGDVTWNKNLPRLIEAAQKAGTFLVMVGKALTDKVLDRSNPWNKDLIQIKNIIKNGNNIVCTGFVPTEDLVFLYNQATVFTMPSLYEGFGLPILEAMSCGCPVVTSREGSISEVAGEAAFYVDPKITENIAMGLKKVFFNEKIRNELSKKGLIHSKKFTWRKTAERTTAVYKKLYRETIYEKEI